MARFWARNGIRVGGKMAVHIIRRALDEALSFTGEIDTALVATILDKVVVKKESTKDDGQFSHGRRLLIVQRSQKSEASSLGVFL